MQEIQILGISGSPRKRANTAKLVEKALEGAASISGVKTDLYEMAGKKFHHCMGCLKCSKQGACIFKDDLQPFIKKWMEADAIIWGAPVYVMGIPGSMKAAIDRLVCSTRGHWRYLGQDSPRYNKVCGVLAVGYHRHGGQESVLTYLINQAHLMNCLVVSGDVTGDIESYIGASAWTMGNEDLKNKDGVLTDERGIATALNVGKRVAETVKIVKAGINSLSSRLPKEYYYTWEEIER